MTAMNKFQYTNGQQFFRSRFSPTEIPLMGLSRRHPNNVLQASRGQNWDVRDVECPITSPLKSHTYPNHVLRASHGNPSFGTKADIWTSRGRPRESHGKNRMSLGHPNVRGRPCAVWEISSKIHKVSEITKGCDSINNRKDSGPLRAI